jgi:hypothetical protein
MTVRDREVLVRIIKECGSTRQLHVYKQSPPTAYHRSHDVVTLVEQSRQEFNRAR